MAKRLFVSFDYDHDADLKVMFVGQARLPDSPFELADWSIKVASPTWVAEARRRIRACDTVAVICGQYTRTALGVDIELKIAREERIPYFLLMGRKDKICYPPSAAAPTDKMYDWTWPNLKILVGGGR